jgi:hypothetical protein
MNRRDLFLASAERPELKDVREIARKNDPIATAYLNY